MLIINLTAESNGAHASQMTNFKIAPPDGYVVVPPALESIALPLLPWVNLAIENGVVTAVEDDTEAREAWENQPKPEPTPEEQIAALKSQLAATDYKIIKYSEYQLAELEAPYDVVALHAERQEIRDQINELEAQNAEQ